MSRPCNAFELSLVVAFVEEPSIPYSSAPSPLTKLMVLANTEKLDCRHLTSARLCLSLAEMLSSAEMTVERMIV